MDPRSDEDQDLLERSTKKSKTKEYAENGENMGQDHGNQYDQEGRGCDMEFVMETPLEQIMENGEGDERANEVGGSWKYDEWEARNQSRNQNPWNNKVSFREVLTGKEDDGKMREEDYVSDDDAYDVKDDNVDCPIISLTKEEKARIRKPWRQTLIIKVLGRTVGYTYLLKWLKTIWRPKAAMELVSMENDYHLVRFASVMDYEFAKLQGPWTVLDHYLAVKNWEPDFDPATDKT